jgi:hypothetical protein
MTMFDSPALPSGLKSDHDENRARAIPNQSHLLTREGFLVAILPVLNALGLGSELE